MYTTKVIVSVSNDLSNDQRVHRICATLQQNGYEVVVIARKLKSSDELEKRIYKIKRFKLLFNNGFLFYLSLNIRFFIYLIFHKADILLSNDLDTLLCNTLVSILKKTKLIYDSHELFTEVPELQTSNFKKKIWLKIENYCIKRTTASYTVSSPIADFYNNKYNINMQLVRNLPVEKPIFTEYKDRKNILIYQGALNLERGIEILIESLLYLPEFNLIIAGKGYLERDLKNLTENLKLSDRVDFTGNLDFEQLHYTTCKAKLGFSIEQGKSLNYYYALPNKIFDYIQAAVPVICSDFPEMKNTIITYRVGNIFRGSTPEELSLLIKQMIYDQDKLNEYSDNCLKAKKILNWENEQKKLLSIFNQL